MNTNWFPGNLRGEDGHLGGFLFAREQAEKFYNYWATAASAVIAARQSSTSFAGRMKNRISGQSTVYAQLNGRNIGMIFRVLDSDANLTIQANAEYNIRVDMILLALEVLTEAVARAQVNESLGYAEQKADNPLTFIRGAFWGSSLLSELDLIRQNRELLAAYGGQWPEKTRTMATDAHLHFMKEIDLNKIDIDTSLKRFENGHLDVTKE